MWPQITVPDLALAHPFDRPKLHNAPLGFRGFVYFDIGSVLIDLDWDSFFAGLPSLPGLPRGFDLRAAQVRLRASDLIHQWSVGTVGPAAYAERFLSILGIPEAHQRTGVDGSGRRVASALDAKRLSSLIVGPVRARMLRLAKRLRAENYALGILSNATPWHEADIEATLSLRDNFDVVIFSQDVGHEKPDRGIYDVAFREAARYVECRFGHALSRGEVFFVDDTPANVVAAREHGWQARLACLVKEEFLSEPGVRDIEKASLTSENLLFGDAAARRIESLFTNLVVPE